MRDGSCAEAVLVLRGSFMFVFVEAVEGIYPLYQCAWRVSFSVYGSIRCSSWFRKDPSNELCREILFSSKRKFCFEGWAASFEGMFPRN